MNAQRQAPPLRRLLRLATLAAGLPWLAGTSLAGTASTPDLGAIFGAANFGSQAIAVHWLAPGAPVIDAGLTTISGFASLLDLAIQSPDASPVIDAFFVDHITWCNGLSGSHFVGCTIQSSNVMAVESSFAAGASGAIGIAHELGHTMGLGHVASAANLMNPVLGSTALTTSQAGAILASDKVQTAADGSRFIEIRPIAVLATVPEPATCAQMLAGLACLAAARLRARRGQAASPA